MQRPTPTWDYGKGGGGGASWPGNRYPNNPRGGMTTIVLFL